MSESDSGRDSPLVDSRPKPTYHQPKLVDEDKNTNLHYAAAAGDVDAVVDYLENESRIVDPENYLGWTPLMMACRKGHFAAVKTLLSYRANATIKNRFGMNVFQIAISSGNLELVEYLLDHFLTGGISKRVLERNFSTLSLAVLFRHQSVLEFLIKKRFQIDLQTPIIGISPLMFAQAIENDPAISTLLQNKVDTKLKSYLGHTAVDIATIRQQMKLININEHKNVAQKMSQATREAVDNEMQNQQLRSLLQINNKPSNNTPTVLQPSYNQNQVPCIVLTPYPQGAPMGYLQVHQNQMLPSTRKSSNVSPFQVPAPPNVSPITPLSLGNVEGQIFFPPTFSPSQVAPFNMASPVFSSLASQSYNAGDILNARFNSSAAMFFSPPVLNFLSPCM